MLGHSIVSQHFMEPEGSIPNSQELHLFLSLARPIQSTSPHPTSPRSILILSTHLHISLPSGLFPSGFPTNNNNNVFRFLATDPEVRDRFPALPETKVLGLERGPLILVSITEELLDIEVAAPV
jgi:hypothetical protein